MTSFRFNPVVPHPLLQPIVAKMWAFESSGRLPAEDVKLIVPNANLKLTLTFRNGIVARIDQNTFIQTENKLSLTGLIDQPVILDPTEDVQTGTIVVEFNPLGAYRLFHLSYAEIKNQIVEIPELMGREGEKIQTQLAEVGGMEQKLRILQQYLINQLEKSDSDNIFDHCIRLITDTKGLVSVAQLEKETGYSSRWLHRKFFERLGTGPKNLSEIIRFSQFYHVFSAGAAPEKIKEHIYRYYYDQSHFLRAFRRFTGFTPTSLQNSINELSTKNFTS